jgi:hypothetical protein
MWSSLGRTGISEDGEQKNDNNGSIKTPAKLPPMDAFAVNGTEKEKCVFRS